MTLLESLLDAIVRLEGDALVMHVGEKPYVVTTSSSMNAYRGPLAWGQVELSSRVLTSEAVLSMVGQILPPDQRQALDDMGAIEQEIAPPSGVTDRFTVVAARGGDDIWLELRRHPMPVVRPQPAAVETPAAAAEAGTLSIEPGFAVGLQEPPHAVSVPEQQSPYDGTRERDGGDAAEPAVRPHSLEPPTIEERVPVLDEAGAESAERVEHITIPVNGQDDEDASVLEVVDPEAQHTPTDEDVDALLAATAGTLLTGGIEARDQASEPSDSEWTIVGHEEAAEVADGIAFGAADATGDVDSGAVDLSAALDELPASRWSPELDEGGGETIAAAETTPPVVEEAVAAAESSAADVPAADEETVAEPESRRPSEAPGEAAAALDVPAPASMSEPVPAAGESPPSVLEVPLSPAPQVGPEVVAAQAAGEQSSSTPETHVDHSAALPKARPDHPEASHAPGVVVPMSRSGAKPEKPAAGGRVDDQALLQMLRVAAERAASTVYVVAQSRPMIRVDGEISALEAEPVFSAADIERLTATLAPRRPDAAAPDSPVEWISEVPDVGRVRCVTFRDHRGPGLIFRMISARSISADHLNLSAEIRDLAAQADGLVIVTGGRGSGKSTLMSSFVDLINRTRSDHVITIETEIGFVHESRRSFISQREVHNDAALAAATAHAALKEDPDVLVIEDVHSAESVSAALSAAESGRLVFVSITASSSVAALDALVDLFPAPQRAAVRGTLSRTLRAVVSQVLLRKAAGGRVTARELLVNSPAVAASIREGKASEAAAAVEAGQRHGMVSMNESLAGLVRGGTVHSAEAYRRAPDRAALLACLAREGVDTSFAERLA